MLATFMEFARRKAAAAVHLIRDSDPGERRHIHLKQTCRRPRDHNVRFGTSGSDELRSALLHKGRYCLSMVGSIVAHSLEHGAEL